MALSDLMLIPSLEVFEFEDNELLCQLFVNMHSSLCPEFTEKEIFSEGAKDIWAVLRFRERIDEAKNYLQAHQLDFEKQFSKRRMAIWNVIGNSAMFDETDYDSLLSELTSRKEDLESEKCSLTFRMMTDEMYPRLQEVEKEIDATEERIQSARKYLNYKEELEALDEAEHEFEEILRDVRRIFAMINNYLAESKHASLIKEFDNDLLFADIIDVTYDLFKKLFDPKMTKVQLLLALNLRGAARIPIQSKSQTAISVMIFTIVNRYDPRSQVWKTDREEWAGMVHGFFGIKESSYKSHRYAKNTDLAQMWKERVDLFEEYLASLDRFKQEVSQLLGKKV